jgi:hypothetical protein
MDIERFDETHRDFRPMRFHVVFGFRLFGTAELLEFEDRQGTNDWPLLFGGPANGPYESKPATQGFGDALWAVTRSTQLIPAGC